ncbi:MAG: carbohydrate binding family 9 domain-containing protein [Candidatus Aminicenantes bacterium]|nr:carbohydrate binding family 9 domain-containing protein [Candidatus Aminicenantes bacterium]
MRLQISRPLAAIALISLVSAGTASAGQTEGAPPAAPKKVYTTARVNPHVPAIDGKVDDEVWAKVPWEGGFIQSQPYEGREPTEKTEFKVLYDDKAVYIAVRAYDSEPKTIERRLARRDDCEGDMVTVAIDSLFDHLTAFVFTVNAAGVKADQVLVNDGQSTSNEEDMSWDPIWDVATAVDEQGWTAEMEIPLSQLRFGTKPEQVWGFQVRRTLFRKDESSDWQFIPRNASGLVHLFGELHGLSGLTAPHQIEIMPYTVGRIQSYRAVAGNPFAKGSEQNLQGGVDGKVGVTSDLTMNFTVNPDFGQVEADPSVVNLTAFETYYEEKRPFFVEGRNIINFQIMGGDGDFSQDNLFYSRRIGRYPQYYPETGGFVDMPEATHILGAFKLTGKTRSGLSVGVLNSVTGRERASVFEKGLTSDVPVEPMTNYFSLRVQQDYNKGATTIGGMMTAVNRSLKDDGLSFLHRAAYSGGLDVMHSWKNKNYYFSLKLVASRVEGAPDAILRTQLSSVHYYQRPDAGHVEVDPARTSLSGTGGTVEFGKQGGGHLMFVAGATWRSPGFDLNDMGYLRQGDVGMQYFWAGYRIWEPFGPFRSFNINFNQWSGWNFAGVNIFNGGNVNGWAQLKNYWSLGGGYNVQGAALSQTSLRGGPSLRVPPGRSIWFNLETDMRKKVRFSVFGNGFERFEGESKNWTWGPGLNIVPSAALQLSLSPQYSTNRSRLQYIGTRSSGDQSRYLFGSIDQTTLALTIRLNYSLTPDLSVQFYGMPFVSAGTYREFKRITDSRARDYGARYHIFGPDEIALDGPTGTYTVDENGDGAPDYSFGNPNFNFRQFRANLVLRWEYTPGSALYVVWSQGRTGYLSDGAFDFGRDLDGLFGLHPHNVFLVKFSYCFQL